MRVTEGGIRKQHFFLVHNPFGKPFRPLQIQNLLGAVGRGAFKRFGQAERGKFRFGLYAYIVVAVNGYIGNVVQKPGAAVQRFREDEKFGVFINKRSIVAAVMEAGVCQHVFKEQNIGFNAADAEFF